jgi:outer membrane lipoprotein-sorting protein
MKARLWLSVLIIISLFLSFIAIALAEDFSADMISRAQGAVSQGKVFITNDKARMEFPGGITITRMDKKVAWILMPEQKMYMEQPLEPTQAPSGSGKVEGETERKLIGKEMVDGKMADKYQVFYNVSGNKGSMFIWLVPGLNMPVKTAAIDNSWSMEYRNIRTDKQPDALFEIPAGYQKFSYNMPSMQDVLGGRE